MTRSLSKISLALSKADWTRNWLRVAPIVWAAAAIRSYTSRGIWAGILSSILLSLMRHLLLYQQSSMMTPKWQLFYWGKSVAKQGCFYVLQQPKPRAFKNALQGGPAFPHQKFGDARPGAAARGIGLVAVQQQNVPVQQGRLINVDAGKQPAERRFVVLPVEVVIAPDFDIAGLLGIAVMKCGSRS